MIAFLPSNKCLPSKWSSMSNMSFNQALIQHTLHAKHMQHKRHTHKNIPHTIYRTHPMCATYTTRTHQVYIIYSTYRIHMTHTSHIEYNHKTQNIHYTHNSNACNTIICTIDAYNIYKALTSYSHKTYSRHTYTHTILSLEHMQYTQNVCLKKQHAIEMFTIYTRNIHSTYVLTQCTQSIYHKCNTHTHIYIHATHTSKPEYESPFTLDTTERCGLMQPDKY